MGIPSSSFQRDASAMGQVVVFLVAGLIFLASVAGVLLAVRNAGTSDRGAMDAAEQKQAERLADLLVGSPGVGWAKGADSIQRLGLGAVNGSGLQQSSIDSLRGALLDKSANGRVDYRDALAGLALGSGGTGGFHVRVYPVGMNATYATNAHVRTAYVGDWESLVGFTVPKGTGPQMSSSTQARINTTMFEKTAHERESLRSLGLDFDDKVYVSTVAPVILVDEPFPLLDVDDGEDCIDPYTQVTQPGVNLKSSGVRPLLYRLTDAEVDVPSRSAGVGPPSGPASSADPAKNANRVLFEGDVYPDDKNYLNCNLPSRLPLYRLLIVGSGVDHSALTSAIVKDAIREWVLAGGTLIVLGTPAQNHQWLQPLFHVGVSTANGSPTAPDVAHPVLMEPHTLDWTGYRSHGRGWDIKSQGSGAHDGDFSHVIVQGGKDVLAVSKDGAFGRGRVILTTFMPTEVAQDLGQQEAQHFLYNLIVYSDRSNLYLDYGPLQPEDQPVAVAVRHSHLWDSKLGQVPVRVEVHYWT